VVIHDKHTYQAICFCPQRTFYTETIHTGYFGLQFVFPGEALYTHMTGYMRRQESTHHFPPSNPPFLHFFSPPSHSQEMHVFG
jgi:hypothetical protein